MSDKTYQTTLLIRGDSKNAVKSVKLTRDELEKLTGAQRTGATATQKFTAAFGKANLAVGKATRSFSGLQGLIGALGLGKLVSETIQAADTYASLQGQLKLVTGSQEELNAVYDEALALSNATGQSTESTVKLYARLARSTEELGLSQKELFTITEAINQSFVVSGATAQEAASATLQLSQGFAAGALRGEELNSVMENSPRLARAIADGLGVTIGQLRAMGAAGELSAEAVTGALLKTAHTIEGEFNAMPMTISRVMQTLANDVNDALGRVDTGPLIDSVEELRAIIADPAFRESITSIAAGLLDMTAAAVSAMSVTVKLTEYLAEEFAAAVGGAAVDDIPRLEDELAKLERRMYQFIDAGGSLKSIAGVGLVDAIDKLEGKIKLANEITNEWGKSTDKTADAVKKAATQTDLYISKLDNLKSRHTATTEIFAKAHNELDKLNKSTRDMIDSLEHQVDMLDMTGKEQAIATALRKADTTATEEQKAQIAELTGALYDEAEASKLAKKESESLAKASKKAAEDSQKAWLEHRDLLSGFFFEMAADGKNAFDTLLGGFKAMIAKMVAEAAANQVLLGFGGIAGALGFSSAASGATAAGGGGGGFLSTGASLLTSGFSGIGGLYQQAGIGLRNLGLTGPGNAAFNTGLDYANSGVGANLASAGMNIGAGLIGGYAGSQVFGETSGLGATAGGLVGSIYGPVGAGIGSFIGTGIEKGLAKVFGQKNNGDNKGRSVIDLANGTVDIFGEGKSFNDANVDAIGGVTDVIQQFAAVLGGSVSTLNISAGNNSGLNIGNESFGEDTEAFFAAAFDYVIRGAENMDGYMKRLLLTFDGTTDEMILFTQSVVSLNEQIKSNPVDDAIAAYEQAQQSITTIYTQQITTIDGLIKNFDGSAIAAAELNAALISNRQYAYELATAILGLGDQMNAMFASSAQQIRESILTDEEKIAAWTKTRDELRSSLSGILDPAELQATGQEVNRLNSQIFNTLSDDAKLFSAETFARYAEDTGDIVQGQLDMALAAVQTTQEQINSTVNSMLHDTAARMEISTNAFSEAVDKFVGATDKDAETADKNADTAIKGTAPPINGLAVGGGIFTGQNNFNPTTGEFDMTMAEYFQYLKDTGNYVPSGNEVNV